MKSPTISLFSFKECLSMTDECPFWREVGEPNNTNLLIHAKIFTLHDLLSQSSFDMDRTPFDSFSVTSVQFFDTTCKCGTLLYVLYSIVIYSEQKSNDVKFQEHKMISNLLSQENLSIIRITTALKLSLIFHS
jgi:hypothetical protein